MIQFIEMLLSLSLSLSAQTQAQPLGESEPLNSKCAQSKHHKLRYLL